MSKILIQLSVSSRFIHGNKLTLQIIDLGHMKLLPLIMMFHLLSLGSCLHITHNSAIPGPTLSHQDSPLNIAVTHNYNYRTFLEFMHDINLMNNNAGFIKRTLVLKYNHQYPQLQTAFTDVYVGIRAIKKSLIQNNLLVNTYTHICPKNGTFSKAEILRYLDYTIQKEKIALDILIRTPQLSGLVSSAQEMYRTAQKYAKLVIQTLNGVFCHNVSQYKPPAKKPVVLVFQNNLSVNNWYYGTATQMGYIAFLRAKSLKNNLTACPITKPFVRPNQNVCFNCPAYSIYNLGTNNCDSCPDGKILDIDQGICKNCYGQIFLINHRFLCVPCTIEAGQYYSPTTFTCQTCGLHSFLNASTVSCQLINCPANRPRFNRQLLTCEKCPPHMVIDSSDPSICLNPKLIGICPANEPYYISKLGKCAVCPAGTVYNNGSHICEVQTASTIVHHPRVNTTKVAKVANQTIVHKPATAASIVKAPQTANTTQANVTTVANPSKQTKQLNIPNTHTVPNTTMAQKKTNTTTVSTTKIA